MEMEEDLASPVRSRVTKDHHDDVDDTTIMLNDGELAYDGEFVRWIALTQLCLLQITNSFQSVIFATIVDQSRDFFHVSNQQLNWLAVVFNIMFFIVGPFTQQIYRVFGLKRGIGIQSFCNCLGIGIKVLCAVFQLHFGWLMVSQIFAALGTVPGAPPALAGVWFPAKERTFATAISSAANNLGNAVGLLIPPLIVTSADKGQFVLLFSILFGCTVVDFFLISVVVPKKPRRPPSAAAAEIDAVDEAKNTESVLQFITGTYASVFQIMKSRNFAMLAVAYGFVNGVYWALADFSAQVMQPFGITEAEVGGMGFTSIGIGSVVSVLVSLWIDKKRKYWTPSFFFVGLTALACGGMNWLLYTNRSPSVVLVWILWSLVGTVQSCAVPVGFEFGAELSFPNDAALSGAVIMTISNGIAMITILALNPYIPDNPDQQIGLQVLCVLGALWGMAAILAYLVPEDLRRYRFEQAQLAANRKDGSEVSSPQPA